MSKNSSKLDRRKISYQEEDRYIERSAEENLRLLTALNETAFSFAGKKLSRLDKTKIRYCFLKDEDR